MDNTKFQKHLQQVPSEDNGHLAICSVTIGNGREVYEDFGFATPDMVGGSTQPKELIDKACQNAKNNVTALKEQIREETISMPQNQARQSSHMIEQGKTQEYPSYNPELTFLDSEPQAWQVPATQTNPTPRVSYYQNNRSRNNSSQQYGEQATQ